MISLEIQHFLKLADESHKFAEKLIDMGLYDGVHEDVTDEQARESFQWAEEFKQVVEAFLVNSG